MAERAFQILPYTDHSSMCRGFLSNVRLICRGNFEAVELNNRQPDNYILWILRFNYILWILRFNHILWISK